MLGRVESQEPSTRDRILAAAVDLFTGRSYQAASMRQIAEAVGITKASLYHHFRSKDEILTELLTPLLDQLDDVLTAAATERGLVARRRQVLEGSADVMLSHREVLMLLRDTSVYGEDGLGLAARIMVWTQNATKLLAGRGGWKDQVRAAQALSALADPISLFADVPADRLRSELLAGSFLLLDVPT
jgi:AcrR family transcriptional regulator